MYFHLRSSGLLPNTEVNMHYVDTQYHTRHRSRDQFTEDVKEGVATWKSFFAGVGAVALLLGSCLGLGFFGITLMLRFFA